MIYRKQIVHYQGKIREAEERLWARRLELEDMSDTDVKRIKARCIECLDDMLGLYRQLVRFLELIED